MPFSLHSPDECKEKADWQKTNGNSKFVFSHLVHVLYESFVSKQLITTLIGNVSLFGFIKHQKFALVAFLNAMFHWAVFDYVWKA